MTADVADEVMSPAQVAKYLGLPLSSVWELLRRHELPGVRLGRRWRTRRSDLDALLSAKPTTPSATATTPRPVPIVTAAPALGRPGRPRKRRRLRDRGTPEVRSEN